MIRYETYKVLHILGVLLAFATLGGLALTMANGAPSWVLVTRACWVVLAVLVAIPYGVLLGDDVDLDISIEAVRAS